MPEHRSHTGPCELLGSHVPDTKYPAGQSLAVAHLLQMVSAASPLHPPVWWYPSLHTVQLLHVMSLVVEPKLLMYWPAGHVVLNGVHEVAEPGCGLYWPLGHDTQLASDAAEPLCAEQGTR